MNTMPCMPVSAVVSRVRGSVSAMSPVARMSCVANVVPSVSTVSRMTAVMTGMTTMTAVSVLTNSTECHCDESNTANGKRGQVYVHA